MTRVVLLGGTGFIGKALLPLLQEKFHVKTLVHNNSASGATDTFSGDIRTPGLLDSQIEDGDVIINLIGQWEGDPAKFIDNNIIGGLNLLNSSIKKKNVRIILVSSINVYGENLERPSKESDIPRPQTSYGFVKLCTEKLYEYYSKSYGLDVTVLRLSMIYGPCKKTGFIARLIEALETGERLIAYNNGLQERDLLFIDDGILGIIQSIKNLEKGYQVYNISSSQKYTINDIITLIQKISDKKLNIAYSNDLPDERCLSADYSLAKTKLQFQPLTKIEDGLKTTLNTQLL